jgi:pseudaminic acid synthase
VAEMGNAFNGDAGRLCRMIVAAKAAGADLVKFQAYLPSELIALRGDGPAPDDWGRQGFTMQTLYERAKTPLEWFDWLPAYCRLVGIPWFSSVFGAESLAVLERADCPAYKIARLDNQNDALYLAVRATGKPVIVSAARGQAVPVRDSVLLCPIGYPQAGIRFGWYDFNESVDDHRGLGNDAPYIGFSYHGTDSRVCVTAATLGAKIIEAHFMLDDEPSDLEANVSLGEAAFRRMVDDVRAVEVLLGDL